MGRASSDASTSTDDVTARPLCLFYFTHPFGVLSPEPPTVTAAPAHVARAYVNMQSAPYAWGAGDGPGPGVLSSSLFTGGAWCGAEPARRPPPYHHKTLPPLQLPAPRECSAVDDTWPRKCYNTERFSLPPIEMPAAASARCPADEAAAATCSGRARTLGVRKARRGARRAARADLRRVLAALMRRALAEGVSCGGGGGASPALRDALTTIREAWTEPRSLRAARATCAGVAAVAGAVGMARPRPDASPGLLRRRYSVPETVMRKYRLAQQRSDSDDSAPPSSRSAASAAPRAPPALPACCCCAPPAREVRSLGASRCELRPHSALGAPAPTPPRPRLDRDMLRAAMRNSYERARPPPPPAPPGDTSGSLSASPCTTGEPLSVQTSPPYDVLEIVVSETLHALPRSTAPTPDRMQPKVLAAPARRHVDIDEYVSNILVESLNSLTDQLECMNATMGGDRQMSVVEKEIKVKLQNAGVNTVVHLSPTSNHQIIFGNEELYHAEGRRDQFDEHALSIREEPPSAESNDIRASAEHPVAAATPSPCPCDPFDIHHDDVDRSVLQQIQKLFQDELRSLAPDEPTTVDPPEVSHVDISDVDAFIDGAEAALAEREGRQVYGCVGAGNYYSDASDRPVVPRFSALPHTDSMEVNASSSDDAELGGSDCTSLVDSLDDPNSPRYPSSRRPRSRRQAELVRSAVAVLDLLPERTAPPPRDKPESFFIGIADDERARLEENVTVAERMPEVIKQRLHRRHRKREQRMESARRSRARPPRRDRAAERARRTALERDCAALVGALVDDVIAKIALDEYRCARVGRRPADGAASVTRTWRRRPGPTARTEPIKAIENCGAPPADTTPEVERPRVHGKLSSRPPRADERAAKRLYQKSEIREGDRCIEILEILECAATSHSSTDTIHSDENQNICIKNKKSRIPVPVGERAQRPPTECDYGAELNGNERAPRRASLPYRRVFDPIPEEPHARRASLACPLTRETRSAATSPMSETVALRSRHQGTMTSPRSRSAATSPRAPPPPPPAGVKPKGANYKKIRVRRASECAQTHRAPPTTAGSGRRARNVPACGTADKCKGATCSLEGDSPATDAPPRAPSGASSDSSESGASALCAPAPRWLTRRRPARRAADASGDWSVTVAGSCRAALPADVEMRLRFPQRAAPPRPAPPRQQEEACCSCRRCTSCAPRLTLTMKKEALDSSILASKSSRKSSDQLPDLETYRASRSKLKSSVKTRRRCSLHCWLPEDGEAAPLRARDGLSVLGSAIVPEMKPRAPTMSERDLTRHLLRP